MDVDDQFAEQAEEISASLYHLIDAGMESKAIEGARKLLAGALNDFNVMQVVSGILMDAGAAASDADAIEQGMTITRDLLDTLPENIEEHRFLFKYNLSNGHAALHRLQPSIVSGSDIEHLQQQKILLQELLLRGRHLPPQLRASILTNYANLLDHLHRTFEALDFYFDCLNETPGQAIASGNCGETVSRIISMSREHRLENIDLGERLFEEALSNPQSIVLSAGQNALHHIEKEQVRFRKEIELGLEAGSETLKSFREHREREHSHPPAPGWLKQILRDRLLLTFNLLPVPGVPECLDDIFFDSLASGLAATDRETSIELIHLFNSIKEEFATSRNLYYQTAKPYATIKEANAVTLYGSPEGDTEFGLISGFLKASFRLSIDLFDKIAVFLSIYFGRGNPPRAFSFNNVWFEGSPKGGVIHTAFDEPLQRNYPLMGLRDLQRDFHQGGFPAPIKDIRHQAVHRWIRMSYLPRSIETIDAGSWSVDDFSDLTLFVLRQAKSAILLLTAAVNLEEDHRRKADSRAGKTFLPNALIIQKPLSSRIFNEDSNLEKSTTSEQDA